MSIQGDTNLNNKLIDAKGEAGAKDAERDSGEMPPDIAEVVEALPPEQQTAIRLMISTFQMTGRNSTESLIAKQFKPEHITAYLDGARENMQREYQDKRENRKSLLIGLGMVLLVLCVLIIVFKENIVQLKDIIIAILGFVGVAFGGYGFAKSKQNDG